MSTDLVDFLRMEGVDEDAGDPGDFSELSEPGVDAERLRFDIFNDQYEEIEPDDSREEPETSGSWVFPTLYKKGADDNTLSYKLGYNSISKKLLWTTGRVETGALQLSTRNVEPTRSQKGSFARKAYTEALTMFKLKLKAGFHLGMTGKSTLAIPVPMLANKYRPPDEKSEGNVPIFPVAAQAKFDGERHMVFIDSKTGETGQYTRTMNPRMHFDHIRQECTRLLEFLPIGTILDGELYSPKVKFQLITSIAGVKIGQHPREKELDYYVFDLYHPDTVWYPGISKKIAKAHRAEGEKVEDMVYMRANGYTVENYTTEATEYYELPQDEEGPDSLACIDFAELLRGSPMWVVELRVALLMNAFRCYRAKYQQWPRHVKLVKTFIVHSQEDILKLFDDIRAISIESGEKLEGIMLRQLSRGDSDPVKSLYRPGRSDFLLKVKAMQTTEVIVTGVKAGKGKAKDQAMLTYREPGTGLTGTLVLATTASEKRRILLDPASVKGKILTVSFQNRMDSGKMRFPVGKDFVEQPLKRR